MSQHRDRAVFVAFDERQHKVVEYDLERRPLGVAGASLWEKRQGSPRPSDGSCSLVTRAQLQRMTDYQRLEETAATLWGADWNQTLTNDPLYPDSPASVCVSTDPQTMTLDGEPSCSSSNATLPMTVAQAAGSVDLSYERSTSTTARVTISKAAIFPMSSVQIATQLNTPSLTVGMESLSSELTFHNEQNQIADVKKDSVTTELVRAAASSPGQSCTVKFTNSTCTGKSTGRIQVQATGWLWFQYNEPRDGHHRWAVSIDEILQEDQRSSWIEFKAGVQSWGITNATPMCEGNEIASDPANETHDTESDGGIPNSIIIGVSASLGGLVIVLGVVVFFLWRRRKTPARELGEDTRSDLLKPPTSSYMAASPLFLTPFASSSLKERPVYGAEFVGTTTRQGNISPISYDMTFPLGSESAVTGSNSDLLSNPRSSVFSK
ncbi:hypothetical protein BKA62DRAFT_76440 [Auriculariales sp. MPI-PUGE-AT-0066]|nr:hypothetical protein BKA62DRAFT_76440 [Auriculariales sp. MPI-PUGE-AT-0066]